MGPRNFSTAFFTLCMVCAGIGVNGFEFCGTEVCSIGEYCCGSSCCDLTSDESSEFPSSSTAENMYYFVYLLLMGLFIIGCPICCYRCCCRRTTNRGRVYNTGNMPVTISLPPQQVTQQVPYPTVVPYPQQTPYPPQYPTNPYFNAPPPSYAQTVEAGTQQQSPSAPPLMTL